MARFNHSPDKENVAYLKKKINVFCHVYHSQFIDVC
jgi:hypothetical protein